MELLLKYDILDKGNSSRLGDLIMSSSHQPDQIIQYLAESLLSHLLSADLQDLTPSRVSSILKPQVIDLILRDAHRTLNLR